MEDGEPAVTGEGDHAVGEDVVVTQPDPRDLNRYLGESHWGEVI